MIRSALLAATLGLALPACRGTVPERNAPPEQAISAILIGGRMVLPSGETNSGYTYVNFESTSGHGETYRLPISAGKNSLYLVEPDAYRLTPTRSIFGFYKSTMKVVIDGRSYKLPFPREVLRLDPYAVKPSKILSLGILEARVQRALPGRKPQIEVRLDDSVAARRKLVQDVIREMMDPTRSADDRDSAIAWTQALQVSLMQILAEEDHKPMYTPAP